MGENDKRFGFNHWRGDKRLYRLKRYSFHDHTSIRADFGTHRFIFVIRYNQ